MEALCGRSLRMDCRVFSPAMTKKERKNERNIGGETPTDARSSSAAPCGCGRCPHPDPPPLAGEGMGGGSTSIGVPPRFSSQGVFHRQGTQHQARLPATWRGHVLRIPLSGRYPPLPVPVQRRTSHSGRNAGGLMPNAARERVASPPAGSALARRSPDCLRATTEYRARFEKCM